MNAAAAFSQSQLQQCAILVRTANVLVFEILNPNQAGLLIAALQVDVFRRPIHAWMEWMKILSSGVLGNESGWIDVFRSPS